jgi:hypothetical protein
MPAAYAAAAFVALWAWQTSPEGAPVVAARRSSTKMLLGAGNTLSNLMFAAFQCGVAERLATSTVTIVALQAVGVP